MSEAVNRTQALGDRIDARIHLLHNLTDDYLNGRISVMEYGVGRELLGPDYDEMGRHLYRVAKQGNTADLKPVLHLLPWWERLLYRLGCWFTSTSGQLWIGYVWGFIAGMFAVWIVMR